MLGGGEAADFLGQLFVAAFGTGGGAAGADALGEETKDDAALRAGELVNGHGALLHAVECLFEDLPILETLDFLAAGGDDFSFFGVFGGAADFVEDAEV